MAQSTASCCISSDISAFLITAFLSDILVALERREKKKGKKRARYASLFIVLLGGDIQCEKTIAKTLRLHYFFFFIEGRKEIYM